MKFFLPILGLFFSLLTTVIALVFCMAMGANSSPAQIRVLKLWLSGLSLLVVISIVISIVLMRSSQTGWATGIAFLPMAVIAIIFMVSVLK